MTVRMVAWNPRTEFATNVMGLYENDDGTGRSLVFDLAHEFTDQDRALGLDAYSMAVESGAVDYAPVERCEVSAHAVRFYLKPASAARLGLPETLDLRLKLDPAGHRQLVDALRSILGGGSRPAPVAVSK